MASALISTGGNLLGKLGSWLGGRGELKRLQGNYDMSRNMLLDDIGEDIIDPQETLAILDVAQYPQLQAAGRQIARRSGNINAPDAQGALWERQLGNRQDMYGNLLLKNAMAVADRDAMNKRLLYQYDANALARY